MITACSAFAGFGSAGRNNGQGGMVGPDGIGGAGGNGVSGGDGGLAQGGAIFNGGTLTFLRSTIEAPVTYGTVPPGALQVFPFNNARPPALNSGDFISVSLSAPGNDGYPVLGQGFAVVP